MVKYMTERVRDTLRADPNANIISVSQNDNFNYCRSPEEMAIINEEGTPGGALFRAINTVADAVRDEFPHVAIDTLAYQWSRPAPAHTIPRPNVIIRLCSIECNFAAPLTDASNAPFRTDMEKWAAISNRTYIWNYVTNFGNYISPFPNYYVLGPNIQYFAAHGVRGIFEEGSYATSGGDMNALKDFVMGRMLWNHTLDANLLITKFLDGYFGAASPFIRLYMDTFHGSIADSAYYMHENFVITAPFLSPIATLTAADAFNDALRVTSSSLIHQNRVHVAKISVYYVILQRWDEMYDFATKTWLKPWPLEATKEEAFTEFSRIYNILGITTVREGSCDLPCFKSMVFPTVLVSVEASH